MDPCNFLGYKLADTASLRVAIDIDCLTCKYDLARSKYFLLGLENTVSQIQRMFHLDSSMM